MSGFGVYRKRDTFLNRMDPRGKLVAALLFFGVAFCAQGLTGFAVLALLTLVVLVAGGISFSGVVKALKPFRWIMSFVLVFDLLLVSGGTVWWQMGIVSLSSEGLRFALESVIRFACMLLGTSVVMITTSPTQLTDATASLLSPLRRLNVPVDDVALCVGMALRFIPVMSKEMAQLQVAQESRGASYSQGSVAARVKARVPMLISLFMAAFRRSETLAMAVANREYGLHGVRSRYRCYCFGVKDGVALLVLAALLVLQVVI